MTMTDSTFHALAERAQAYPVVQRRNQISKVAFLARKTQDMSASVLSPVCIVV
jgi:hypothetical protein